MDSLLQKGVINMADNPLNPLAKMPPFQGSKEKKEEVERKVVLEVKDLHKSYGKKEVLKGINLEVYQGEVFGFIGKNGAGKSTTIDCIVGLKDFNSGLIRVLDHNVKENPIDAKMNFGYVPSEPVTYEVMTGNEYLQFVASSYGMYQEAFDKNYEFLKNKFMIGDADLNRKIREYSHGMKQKVCLMASLIHNPSIWVLDEPTVGLDIMVYQTLMDMLHDFAANGKTVFVTSHNIDLVSRVCNRVAIINNGVVAELIDFSKEPLKRRNLSKIFFNMYGQEEKKEK
ncbi:MAG: ABC transporter ATP-binding protein [Candidatus Enterosoma sp.]|nr:ABC transporter ATP-binding protein [Candidatus Enterosoma sp.]